MTPLEGHSDGQGHFGFLHERNMDSSCGKGDVHVHIVSSSVCAHCSGVSPWEESKAHRCGCGSVQTLLHKDNK